MSKMNFKDGTCDDCCPREECPEKGGNGALVKVPRKTDPFARLQSTLDAISDGIQRYLEGHFYRIGIFIATYPIRVIAVSLLVVMVASSGMVFFEKRDDQDVWLPEESELHRKKQWLQANFPEKMYQETVLLVGENVLTPETLQFMYELTQVIAKVETEDATWDSLCARPGALIPIMDKNEALDEDEEEMEKDSKNRLRRSAKVGTNEAKNTIKKKKLGVGGETKNKKLSDAAQFANLLGFALPEELRRLFEKFADDMDRGGPCITTNFLSLFDQVIVGDPPDYSKLSREAISKAVTEAFRKPWFSDAQNVSKLLSGVEVGPKGEVVGAKAILMVFMVEAPVGPEKSPENTVVRLWERRFVSSVLDYAASNMSVPGIEVYAFTRFSFIDAMMDVLDQNMPVLLLGCSLILMYIAVTLGKFNRLEHRLYVSLVGVSNVGLSIAASYGLCSYAGLFFGPIHPIVPFILLGIGVDDMFVIIQALKSLTPSEKKAPVSERIGLTLKSAGVSITITSATDVLAFGIGATTVMPSLSSFCLFAASGILAVFLLQLSIFVPCLALDEARIDGRSDACVPCRRVSNDYKSNECSQRPMLVQFFERYFAPFVLWAPVKIATILVTLGLLGVNAYGVYLMRHNFDPRKYIASGSYQDRYLAAVFEHFPRDGEPGAFYIGNIDYWKETENLELLYGLVKNEKYIVPESVDFWHHSFLQWMRKQKNMAPRFQDELDFQEYLREFLISTTEGHDYMLDLVINGTLLGEFRVTASSMKFKHLRLSYSVEKEAAMDAIFCIERRVNFTALDEDDLSVVAFSIVYTPWQANAIISGELLRNLGLTLAAVFTVTLVLIGDIRISLWVFLCVAFILVDIAGSMHFWGLTIEIVTSICLILSVGLAVDYSAHVGHMFVALSGRRADRAKETLVRIGPAVWNGAFSTFLSFSVLMNTDVYVFSAFVKAFFCVVLYGVFHGLVFLPVVLSLIGPSSLSPHRATKNTTNGRHALPSPLTGKKRPLLDEDGDAAAAAGELVGIREDKKCNAVEGGGGDGDEEAAVPCCGTTACGEPAAVAGAGATPGGGDEGSVSGSASSNAAMLSSVNDTNGENDGNSSNLEFVFYESRV